jgi:glycosyltransferase involved in cell wall biosynthesis
MKTLMIVLNSVSNDNRVLKSAHSFQKLQHKIEIYGMSADKELKTKPVLNRISNLPVRLFPNPNYFLSGVKSRVDKWRFMIDYFISSMWVYAEKMSPEIVYTHDYNTILIGKEIVNRLRSQGKFVYWIHDLHEYVKGLTTMDDEIYKLALKHENQCIHSPDYLITVSPMLSRKLTQEYGLSKSPTILINAPEYNQFNQKYQPTVRKVVALEKDIPLMVYVGGVTRARGLHTVVDALPKLSGVHLVLVTNNQGDYIESLKSSAESHQCSDRLHIIPYVTPEMVSSFVRDATVAIHPMIHYLNAEIALPNKLFEYMHGGVPIVVSDCDSMGKFVYKWKIGEVFEAENVDSFANVVRYVIDNKDTYVRHIKEFSVLNQYFSWENQESFFDRLNQDIARKFKSFSELNNSDIDQLDLEKSDSSDLFNVFYDSSLTNSLFSKYYYCSSKIQLNEGKFDEAEQ